ncbi:hypothetical protein [Pelagibius marinus]|uniref:hypothetical protein n=1 Tax=Pelagibius marinus TaxID=2762760 RepID=UPI001872D60B|nr:hypothetical protein [Pelagibius marinus]
MYEWGIRTCRVILFAVAAIACAAAGRGAAAERDLTRAVYDYAVTSYCGTLTPEVEAGFKIELAALTVRAGLDKEAARRLRIRGWVEADREWRNRGLGGQRAWCREEGLPAARHFRAIAIGVKQP